MASIGAVLHGASAVRAVRTSKTPGKPHPAKRGKSIHEKWGKNSWRDRCLALIPGFQRVSFRDFRPSAIGCVNSSLRNQYPVFGIGRGGITGNRESSGLPAVASCRLPMSAHYGHCARWETCPLPLERSYAWTLEPSAQWWLASLDARPSERYRSGGLHQG